MTALAAFLLAALLSVAFRSPVALALTLVGGLAYLFPYLAALLLAAALLFAFTR